MTRELSNSDLTLASVKVKLHGKDLYTGKLMKGLKLRAMDSGDVLGNDGRKVLNACVKVQTCSIEKLQEYDRKTALG